MSDNHSTDYHYYHGGLRHWFSKAYLHLQQIAEPVGGGALLKIALSDIGNCFGHVPTLADSLLQALDGLQSLGWAGVLSDHTVLLLRGELPPARPEVKIEKPRWDWAL